MEPRLPGGWPPARDSLVVASARQVSYLAVPSA